MLKHEFSWSFSRYKLFNRCKLAYFYQYYASWGGWQEYSDDLTRKSYILKKLIKSDNLAEDIFKKSLFENLMKGNFDFKRIERNAFSRLKREMCEIRNPSTENERINLFEKYYQLKNFNQIESDVHTRLSFIFANFAKASGLISDIPYLNLKEFKRPSSFRANGIKVWCSPDLIFENEDKTVVLDLFFRNPASCGNWAFKLAVDAIFAESKWSVRKVEKRSVFLHDDSYPVLGISRNIKEILSIIRTSSHEMLLVTKLDTEIKSEYFPPSENREECNTCNYRELCGI